MISLTHGLFRSVLLNTQWVVNFLVIFLLLIPGLRSLWSQITLYDFHTLKFVETWQTVYMSDFGKCSCAFEKECVFCYCWDCPILNLIPYFIIVLCLSSFPTLASYPIMCLPAECFLISNTKATEWDAGKLHRICTAIVFSLVFRRQSEVVSLY